MIDWRLLPRADLGAPGGTGPWEARTARHGFETHQDAGNPECEGRALKQCLCGGNVHNLG